VNAYGTWLSKYALIDSLSIYLSRCANWVIVTVITRSIAKMIRVCSRATREKRLCGTPIEIFARRVGTVTILIGRVIRNRYRIASAPHDRGNSGILESLSHARIARIAHVTALRFRRERYGINREHANELNHEWPIFPSASSSRTLDRLAKVNEIIAPPVPRL